jgi:hypothetical protein
MRWLVLAIAITAAAPAHAESGYYFSEALGGGDYDGQLGRYGGAPRFELRFGMRRDAISFELTGTFMIPDFLYIDCYGEECAYAARPKAGLGAAGVELRQRWRLLSLKRVGRPGVYERPGLFVSVHGGMKWWGGSEAIEGYGGPGVTGGVSLEGDLWILGYFADLGLDVLHLEGPGETIRGSIPYVVFGGKFGWL